MPVATTPEPDGAPRLLAFDVLRGLAILGILFMNINDMGASINASSVAIRHLGWSRADRIAWWLREVVANGTARCMLELLFGAGMIILTDRAARTLDARAVRQGYYRRNLVLLGFGLVHVFVLLWPGDILHTYALAALIAFPFRTLAPRWLIALGLVAAVLQLTGGTFYDARAVQARVQAVESRRDAGVALTPADRATLATAAKRGAQVARDDARLAADIRREDAARSGTVATWAAAAWRYFIDFQRDGVELPVVWEAAGVMLIGAALFRLGILQGARSPPFYAWLALAGYAAGLTPRAIDAWQTTRFDHSPQLGWATYEIARIATTLGHLGVVHLLLATAAGTRLLRPFAATGRTALSIYILQSLIGLWILFPPFGLALYGRLGWAALMLVALAIDAALLLAATLYLRRYAIGPVEWAWRSLVERRALPFARR